MGALGLKSWRPGELALLIVSTILQVLVVEDGLRKPKLFALLSVATMVLQMTVEGPRWQMILLYAATASTAAVSNLLGNAVRLMVGFLSLSCSILTVIINVIFPWFELPTPTGPYKCVGLGYRVGRFTRELVDTSRRPWVDDKKSGDSRRLMVDFWYPAADNATGERTRYVDREVASTLCESFIGRGFSWLASHVPMVRTASIKDAPAREGRFPVVLFSHGLAATRIQNTALLEELASHGFICASCDHTFDSAVVRFPNGDVAPFDSQTAAKLAYGELRDFRCKQIEVRAADLSFLLDKLEAWDTEVGNTLAGRVDWRRAAAVGHSQGGATAGAAAQLDKRIQAAVLLDAWMWPLSGKYIDNGLPCPSLLWESAEFLGDKDLFLCFNSELSSRLAAASAAAWKCVTDRAGHMEYADMALASPRFLRAIGIIKLGARDMEGFQSFQNGMILDFLRTHLGQAGPRASSASASGAPGAWAPPAELHSGRWGRVLEGGPLREHAAGRGWAPKQRAAVKAVLQSKAKKGEFRPRSELKEDAQRRERLCALIHLLVHHRSLESIRALVQEVEAEIK